MPDIPCATPANAPRSAICPVCGALNDCAMVQPGQTAADCWCMTVAVDPAVLAQLPPEQRNSACLCPRCLQAGH